jgi:iron(III) transport system substrate-binding protein
MRGSRFITAVLAQAAIIVGIGGAHAAPPAALVEAANREGRLVVAGPPIQAHRETIMKFQEVYPAIKLEYDGTPPQVKEPRISAERGSGKFLVDVFISGAGTNAFAYYIPGGWFDELRPTVVDPEVTNDAKWIGGFEAGFGDAGKRYVYAFTAERAAGLFVNKDIVREDFTVHSLTDPKYQGKIASLDPRLPGPGQTTLQQIVANIGEEKACQMLSTQKLVLSETPKQIIDWAARGAYPILIGADTATMNNYKTTGLAKNVQIVPDARGTVLSKWGNIMLMNRAPNPNAAKLFINWILSRDAQVAWSKSAGINSRRTDVEPANRDAVIDADVWANGYNISVERNAADALKVTKLAQTCMK